MKNVIYDVDNIVCLMWDDVFRDKLKECVEKRMSHMASTCVRHRESELSELWTNTTSDSLLASSADLHQLAKHGGLRP